MSSSTIINIVSLEQLFATIEYDPNLPTTDQIEDLLIKSNSNFVSINNVIISAEEFIIKLSRIENTLLRQGEDAAAKRWLTMGLPQPKFL